MKTCMNCNQMMNEDAKFCTNCGAAFAVSEPKKTIQVTEVDQPEGIKTNVETNQKTTEPQTSQVVQNVSKAIKAVEYEKLVKGYWNYFLETLKKPTSSFLVTDRTNGWIQFVLLTLLNSLISVSILSSIPGSRMGIGLFFRLFFVQLIISIAGIGILFVFKNLVQKVNTPFNIVTSQYGGLLSFNIVLQLIVLISALISPIAMISIILIGSILIGIVNVIAFNMYLLNSKNNSKLDNFYVTLLANTVVLIIIAITVRISMEMMIDILPYMFNQYIF